MYTKQVVLALSILYCGTACAIMESEYKEPIHLEPAAKKQYVLEYHTPELFLADFLNTAYHKEKPIKYWASQLILFFQRDPKLKEFCRELARAVPSRDAMRIALVFIVHQHCFPMDIKCVILKDIKKVWHALEARCKCELAKK